MKTKNQIEIEIELSGVSFNCSNRKQLINEIAKKLNINEFDVLEMPDKSIWVDNVKFYADYNDRLDCFFMKHQTTITDKRFKIQNV
jgi:hypothetical protein